MKIVVITGSPHKAGTTALLADSFIEGAKAAGHEIVRFDAASERVHPCIGCDVCQKTGDGCVYKDSMEKLNPELLSADLIALVSPLYYFGFTAQIKNVLDRFYANNAAILEQRFKAVLITAGADNEAWVMDAINAHFDAMCRYTNWQACGRVLALGAATREDVQNSEYPELARRLGASLS